MPASLLILVVFLPMVAAAAIWLFLSARPRLAAAASVGAIGVSFVLTVLFFLESLGADAPVVPPRWEVPWVTFASLQIGFGLAATHLALLMGLVVTGVGGLIHVYSLGYMKDDPGFARYFGCLSLFSTSMLGIVYATNFIGLFIFWELVGLSSYLLIGFWFERPSAAEAGKKAFLVNRLCDFGFLLGIVLLFFATGGQTFDFDGLADLLPGLLTSDSAPDAGTMAAAALLIFVGAVGKSAQFPFHVWLPDAMEGPTPVSALIHAATMVAAGIYMLCRVFFVFEAAPAWVLFVVAIVGALTALLAAILALAQTDLKRILAYSTISQLGYMTLAVGVGSTTAAMFHLTTHAFFKALLFLGAGSVIHALHTQEIFEMGGIRRRMPVTYWTVLVGALALAGVPPLAGFFSKDAVLAAALHANVLLFGLGALTAGITAFYVGRCFFVAFTGEPRGREAEHESPGVMILPLAILGVLSATAGALGARMTGYLGMAPAEGGGHAFVVGVSVFVATVGLGAAWTLYGRTTIIAVALAGRVQRFRGILIRKYFLDEAYDWVVRNIHDGFGRATARLDETVLIGIGVDGTAKTARTLGKMFRGFQTGKVRTYGTYFLLGMAVLVYLMLRGT